MTLYHGWMSSASRRVRLCLAEKGIAYESVPLDMGKQEHHSPEYLALNPNGVVPALRLADGRSLYESSIICEYLDEIQPEPALRPADPYERAVMRNFVRHTDDHCLPHLLILNWSIAFQPSASQWSDEKLQERLARIPTKERREAWIRVARKPYSEEEKAAALAKLLQLIEHMAQMLDGRAWLMGELFTLADIAAVPFIARIAELAPEALAAPAAQRTRDWWERVQQRPAFTSARIDRFDSVMKARASANG
jgi:glutathione S-transferase